MAKKKTESSKKNNPSKAPRHESVLYQCTPYLIIVVALLFEICLIAPNAVVCRLVADVLFGLFSRSAHFLPLLLLVVAVYFRRLKGKFRLKAVFAALCLIMLCVIIHSFSDVSEKLNIIDLFKAGMNRSGGGAIGGFIGSLLVIGCGKVVTRVIGIASLILFGCLLFGLTPHSVWVWTRYNAQKKCEEIKKNREAAEPKQKFRFTVEQGGGHGHVRRGKIDSLDSGEAPPEEEVNKIIAENERIIREINAKAKDMPVPEQDEKPAEPEEKAPRTGESGSGEIDLDRIFSDEEGGEEPELEVERGELSTKPGEKKKEVKKGPKKYILPPTSLLKSPGKQNFAASEEEASSNAIKLVKTLAAFRVKTHISNISRGPTITRYELVPEEGVRVRSVANLVDDISLSLATEGVRIEAPIPGKSAIGIEVPNKNVATVYLRSLIELGEFKNAKSKLTAALGMDVAGEPKMFDIAKMPHLLIAGATGMGKSVCINSIIMSLLFRATPDEVKLILIDPKKVELNVYNGLPHLLVPVVSHPKKAAGTLNWACREMERRFELIEDVGVRDVAGYNEITRNDPEREFLPQIVIIIDELADLMMTAPDDVENSICRLAQKARAAGMHLIIGTQRPSVDVITGLIKANIPSRIAFTVASQIDSRTILDIGGAEKLIGRGDMLFAPVGNTKPIRVQGSFVSSEEVDSVVTFIKRQTGDVEYDSDVVDKIEKEAERCGTGKKGDRGTADAGEDDPRLIEALEVAVDTGKVSTSLLQRRLQVGYGRAAKMVDQMESHGWVGPLEGSKPREIRITKQEYMEMFLNKKDEAE